jgi:tetratricopeptide (TPR) repeat protein
MKNKFLFSLLFFVSIQISAQKSLKTISDSLFAIGRYKKALNVLENSKPSFESNYKKAIIYESIDDYKKTIEFLEAALFFRNSQKAKLKLAKAYKNLKMLDKSIKIYEEILAQDSLNLVLQYQLGKMFISTKKSEKAIQTFKKLTYYDKENANYSYQLALSYALLKDRDRMINSLLDSYRKDTLHLKSIVRLATSFNKLKDADSTRIFVEKGLKINPNEIYLNKLKINSLYRAKRYLETIPYLLKLDTISVEKTYPISMLGKVHYNLANFSEAKKYFRKLIRLDLSNYKAFTYLGHIAMKEQQFSVARLHYSVATTKGIEKRDEEYFGLGNAFYELEKPKEAIFNYNKAFLENRNNSKALYRLATMSDAYYKDKKIAYQHYKKYIENFDKKDTVASKFVKKRIQEIKKEFFLKGQNIK